jgi:hypothetical protein
MKIYLSVDDPTHLSMLIEGKLQHFLFTCLKSHVSESVNYKLVSIFKTNLVPVNQSNN